MKNVNDPDFWEDIYKKMRKPAWLFDTRSVVNEKDIKNIGLNLWKLGSNN